MAGYLSSPGAGLSGSCKGQAGPENSLRGCMALGHCPCPGLGRCAQAGAPQLWRPQVWQPLVRTMGCEGWGPPSGRSQVPGGEGGRAWQRQWAVAGGREVEGHWGMGVGNVGIGQGGNSMSWWYKGQGEGVQGNGSSPFSPIPGHIRGLLGSPASGRVEGVVAKGECPRSE